MVERNRIYCTDALTGLKKLLDESIDMVITSPPYWNSRDYHVKGQLGLEDDFGKYLDKLLAIFDEVKRILKKNGTCWVNIGDSYGGSGKGHSRVGPTKGPKSILPKNLSYVSQKPSQKGNWEKCQLGIPERFMLAMIERGWTLRNKIIWHKPNPMPSSVKDRFTNTWEYLFFFSKSKKYYFDLDAVREPHKTASIQRTQHNWDGHREKKSSWQDMNIHKMCHPKGKNPGDFMSITGILSATTRGLYEDRRSRLFLHAGGKNPGDCWDIPTRGFKGAHFATFPERLIEKPIKTTPRWICKHCGTPKTRLTTTHRTRPTPNIAASRAEAKNADSKIAQPATRYLTMHTTHGWTNCACKAGHKPALILDIFMGSGTTAQVAKNLGRDYIGFELNPAYVKLARKRLAQQPTHTPKKDAAEDA